MSQKCHKTVAFPSHLRTVAVSATGVVTDNSLANASRRDGDGTVCVTWM